MSKNLSTQRTAFGESHYVKGVLGAAEAKEFASMMVSGNIKVSDSLKSMMRPWTSAYDIPQH